MSRVKIDDEAVIDVNAEENVEAGLAEGRLREVNSE